MTDRKLFAKTVKEYLKQARRASDGRPTTLADLAQEVGFTREVLSRKLNAQSPMDAIDVHNIVRKLAKLGAIKSRGQARHLLNIMNVSDFVSADWQTEPLKQLAAEADTQLTIIPEVKELDDRDKEDFGASELLRAEEQEISPCVQAKQEQFGSTENPFEKALSQHSPLPHQPIPQGASIQMQDHVNISTNQGWMNILGSEVGTISVESREHATATNVHSDRGHMLLRLESSYRNSLAQMLHRVDRVELGLTALPATFWDSAPLLPQKDFLTECGLLSGTSIIDAYETAGRELLIVGEAGAGKSTLLFILGQHLVDQTKRDDTHPLPFILPLSTWAIKKLPLEEWIGEQLEQTYHVSQQLSQEWVQQKQILLLLDGLDEVEAAARPACITAINIYHHEHLKPLVVCCRTAAYAAAAVRERLYFQTVVVQPLTLKQVNEGLDLAGEAFAPLKKVFNERTALQEVIKIPLMLRFLLSIDPEPIVQELSRPGTQELSQQATKLKSEIVKCYIQKQVEQSEEPRKPSPYTTQQIQTGLTFLAQKMRDYKQTTFYMEHLQSDWLPIPQFSRLYNWLATRGIGFLLGFLTGLSVNAVIFGGNLMAFDILYGLLGGLIGTLIAGEDTAGFHFSAIVHTLKHQWSPLALAGLRNGFFVGILICLAFLIWPSGGTDEELIYGCGIGACSFFLTLIVGAGKVTVAQDSSRSLFIKRLWKRIVPQGLKTDHCKLGILTGLTIGLSVGVSVGLSAGLNSGYGASVGLSTGLSNGLSTGLTMGLSYTGIGILLCLPLLGKRSTVKLTDVLEWSYKSFADQLISKSHLSVTFRLFLLIVCIFGLGIGISIGLSTGWSAGISNGLKFGLSAGVSVGSAYWILFGLWTGVSAKTLNDEFRIMPNEGIRRSLHNALQIGLWGGVLSILVGVSNEMLYYGLYHGFSQGIHEGLRALLRDGIFIECFGALLPALLMGGITVLRHYLLRLLLWCAGRLPLHTVHFLEDATSRDLLHRDGGGGGYCFAHTYVFDYFADLK